MIVVIAPEIDIKDEINILHELFEAGLNYYHLRKPKKSEKEFIDFLSRIDEKYYKYIVIHQYHYLVKEFVLKGVHLQEQPRIDLHKNLQNYVLDFKSKGFTVSSSFHNPETIKQCEVAFDYYLLSPVFNSISKRGYLGKKFSVVNIDKKIIGMGGVTAENLIEIKNLGFKGAGILGGVWNADNKIEAFKKLNSQYVF